jgi:uncharacterized protein (DUF924 family)
MRDDMDRSVLRDVYDYWVGELASPTQISRERIAMWMQQSDETDRVVRERYGCHVAEAAATEWDVEALSREEAVGLIVLLDQFPRNIHRTTGDAFAHDGVARDVARRLVAGGLDRFAYMERFLIALPFQHNEDVADQDYGVLLTAEMAVNGPESVREFFSRVLDFATKHRDLIRRFGRYPHRNAMLGRESTPEEEAFLSEHGRGF